LTYTYIIIIIHVQKEGEYLLEFEWDEGLEA